MTPQDSIDGAPGLQMTRWLSATAALAAANVVIYGMLQEPKEPPSTQRRNLSRQKTRDRRGVPDLHQQ